MHISGKPESVTPGELGHRIERARRAVGMTQVDLARVLGCDQSTVSRLEGGRGITSLQLSQIAEVTGQPMDFFLRPDLPVAMLLRAENRHSPASSEAIEAFSQFISDYEFLLDLDE